MKVIPTVGVLVFKNGQVLLVKHGDKASHITGVFGWPGGRFEKRETKKRAAARELEEETGLRVKEEDLEEYIHGLAPVKIKRKSGKILTFNVNLFVCTKFSGKLRATDETIPEWVSISELGQYDLLPNVKMLAELIAKQI